MRVETPTEQLFFTTVRIETEGSAGVGTGTGFVFSYDSDSTTALFLVTNRHVIQGAKVGRFFFTRADPATVNASEEWVQPLVGERFDVQVDDFERHWHGHPRSDVDIAVMPLAPIVDEITRTGQHLYFRELSTELIPTPEQVEWLDAIEEILFIGYPNGIFDAQNLLPVARRGTTATPLQIDYGGNPIFLMDASVFPGASGSPVLICNIGSFADLRGVTIGGNRVLFLGIVSGVAVRQEHGQIGFIDIPTVQIPVAVVQQMINLGYVYKSVTVVEAIKDWLQASGVP